VILFVQGKMASPAKQTCNTYALQDRIAIVTGSDSGIGKTEKLSFFVID
jgi:hypothetical protein